MASERAVGLDAPDDLVAPPAGMHGDRGPLFRLIRNQKLAFLVVGVLNTGIGFGFYTLFLAAGLPYLAALVVAHVCAVLCAFVLYRNFVFVVRGHVLRDLARFELVYLASLGTNLVLLPFLVEVVGLGPLLGQAVVTFLTTLISWFGHRHFSFRRASRPPHDAALPGGRR